jgi:glutathione peroxidase
MSRPVFRPIPILGFALCLLAAGIPEGTATAGEVDADTSSSLLQLEARRLGGPTEKLDRYRGQVLLVVNPASRCGYTPQYEGLQSLYSRYQDRGFSVLGFPSNDFGNQEPGSDRQIGAFCRANFGVEFPMFSKVRVRGSDVHPVYAYLTSLPDPIGGEVQWNFQKYLVDREGRVIARYAPGVTPDDPALTREIERLLAEPAPQDRRAGLVR